MKGPIFYQIRIKDHLDDTLAGWFEGLTISILEDGETAIAGYIPDQAALQGVLNQIGSLGLTLISVNATPEKSE